VKDNQQIVEELRAFLQSTDQTLTDPLKELAKEYAKSCQAVNERLRRCEDYLQKGLRSEAVHYAQAEPPLLEQVAVLDFPERAQYEELAALYGLPAPVKLQLETAEALNRAYAEEQPLDSLLRRHRLLALGRAPLVSRLGILRKILELDAANPVWEEDIAGFEKQRFREIQAAVDQGLARNDGSVLSAAWEEIHSTKWLAAPPASLVQHVGRRWLEQLETDIYESHARQDLARLQQLRTGWNQMAQVTRLASADPLWRRPSKAFAWLSKQEQEQAELLQYQNALAQLEQGLNYNRGREELERLAYDVLQFNRGMPPALEMRYQERLQSLTRAVRWKELVVVGVTFSVGLLVLLALVVFAVLKQRSAG